MRNQSILQSLEQTFGKIPQVIRESLKYFTYNDENHDFTCDVCDKIIKLNNGNEATTTENFMKHLRTNAHRSETALKIEILNRLKTTFGNSIPKIVENNVHILGTRGNSYCCQICRKTLEVSTCPSVTEANLAQHFLTDSHANNLITFNENVSVLEAIYGGIPYAIYHNSQYLKLTQSGKNYSCFICKEVLKVDYDDLEETEERFTKHFETEPHLSNAQQERAVSRIPLLDQIYDSSPIPWYVLKNIEYLSVNQTNTALCCSLCDESFLFKEADIRESEQSLKKHVFSETHQSGLKDRRNTATDVYSKLHDLLDDFSEDLVNKIDCLSTYKDEFICGICNVYISEGSSTDELQENIESHLQSSYHKEKLKKEMNRRENLLNDLEDVFGTIPGFIEDEMTHIEYKRGIDFSCTMCDKTLKACKNGEYEENTSKTENNFYKHLKSIEHMERSENLNSGDLDLENHLDNFFSPSLIPYYVWKNVDKLGYKDNNEENNFFCFLCDMEIDIDYGSKGKELTVMNLSKHFLSLGHVTKTKNNAYKKYLTKIWLKSVFGGVSDLIVNNLQHLEQCEDHYRCKICDVQILKGSHAGTSKKNFHSHLNGEAHRSMVELVEDNHEKAVQKLDECFWFTPECLLKNLDFVSVPDENQVYCKACQVTLPLGESLNIHTLRYHFESKDHEHNVGIY